MSINKYYLIGKQKLYHINRSITGEGVRKTLSIIKNEFSNLNIKKIKSGSKIFDWNVPPEWNVSEAYVEDKLGNKIIDFKNNNLHLVGYSTPINKKIIKNNLLRKLYFDKKMQMQYLILHLTTQENGVSALVITNLEKLKKNTKRMIFLKL